MTIIYITVHFSSLIYSVNIHSCHLLFDHFQFALIHGPDIPVSYAILFFTALDFTFITNHIPNWVLFSLGSISSFFLELFLYSSPIGHIGHLLTWGVHLSVSYLFTFPNCSWGSQGKNTEVVWHSLLQWTTFCQNSPPWPICLRWLYTAWLIVSLS